jgi:hypothetical protein
MLKLDISMPKRDISELKLDINILLLLYVAILIALGALGVATKADFVLAKKANVQTTTSPSVKTDGPAAQPNSAVHHRCFAAWEFERTKVTASAC